MKSISLFLIAIYRTFLSSYFGGQCRFYPSCSVYAEEAYKTHSFGFATHLVFKRLCKCHPAGDSGFDPVPVNSKNPAPLYFKEI